MTFCFLAIGNGFLPPSPGKLAVLGWLTCQVPGGGGHTSISFPGWHPNPTSAGLAHLPTLPGRGGGDPPAVAGEPAAGGGVGEGQCGAAGPTGAEPGLPCTPGVRASLGPSFRWLVSVLQKLPVIGHHGMERNWACASHLLDGNDSEKDPKFSREQGPMGGDKPAAIFIQPNFFGPELDLPPRGGSPSICCQDVPEPKQSFPRHEPPTPPPHRPVQPPKGWWRADIHFLEAQE